MANIYQIAEEVGLSPSTVARALRGTGYCSKENLDKIMAAAEKFHYVPSHAAKTLKSKRTNKVLFCIPDIYNPFYFRMIKGATDVLDQHGYYPVLCHTRGEKEMELKMLRNLSEGYGDGMIFVSFDFNQENIEAVNNCGKPVVLTNHYDSPTGEDHFDYVYIDTCEGVRIACAHFIERGHKRIAYIGGNPQQQTGRERLRGFLLAMEQGNCAVDENLIKCSDFSQVGGAAAMEELLALDTLPTAVVSANDLMALGALTACRKAKIIVPQQIALMGMDNSDVASCTSPSLSSVIMQEEQIGALSATLLMERIMKGRSGKQTIRLMPEISIRESSE